MKVFRIFTLVLFLSVFFPLQAQVTLSPPLPTADQEITITYNATQGTAGLVGAERVFMHSGALIDGPSDTEWDYVAGEWGNPNSVGEMSKVGDDLWEITITPRSYYEDAGLTASETVYRLGMVFRSAGPCGGFDGNNNDCAEGKAEGGGDIFVDLSIGGLDVAFTSPDFPIFSDPGVSVTIEGASSRSATLTLKVDGAVVAGPVTNTTTISATINPAVSGKKVVTIEATDGIENTSSSDYFIVRAPTESVTRPAGIAPGINLGNDATRATLALVAPTKSSIYIVGDFTNWEIDPAFQMKRDGDLFWLEVTGLTPGNAHLYHYLLDETVYSADPFSEIVLDPDDQFIPASNNDEIIAYPEAALLGNFLYNRLTVLQTAPPEYSWNITDFQAPPNEELIIYELLVRDYLAFNEDNNYVTLTDTLDYLKNLGVNAIQLMPVMEFSGNNSWGYNPTFMTALDKYYGSINDFKAFIDAAHGHGMAVILDIAMNHNDVPAPYLMQEFNFDTGAPTLANPWFNVSATHPFNVFYDYNHQSSYTQSYLDAVNRFWIEEFHIDGYRFDLSKGFTQVNSGDDVGAWSAYDGSRISLLKRMADQIWSIDPDSYIILEHFADNNEEKELADYGMMLWGNMHGPFKQISLGFADQANIAGTYHGNRGWNDAHLIGYMESHDEERIMVENASFGNSNSGYDVKQLSTSLDRVKAAHTLLMSIPGPKMFWQFGEMGYDVSIDFNGRTGVKPTFWEYLQDPERSKLWKVYQAMHQLKTSYPIFNTTDVTITDSNDLVKQIALKSQPFVAFPSNADEMSVVVVANMDVSDREVTVTFPSTGTWYRFYQGNLEENITETSHTVTMEPGEFRLYTNYPVNPPELEIVPYSQPKPPANLAASALSDIDIELTWTDQSDVETGFIIKRSIDGTMFTPVDTVEANQVIYWDGEPKSALTTYYYEVEAYNTFGKTAAPAITITTPDVPDAPTPPTELIATEIQFNSVALSWTDNSDAELGFLIERALEGEGFEPIAQTPANQTSFTDKDGLMDATQYSYRVAALRGSAISAFSNTLSITTVTGVGEEISGQIRLLNNPVRSSVRVSVEKPLKLLGWSLIDVRGKALSVSYQIDRELLVIDMDYLPQGIYVLRIATNKGWRSFRVLKME